MSRVALLAGRGLGLEGCQDGGYLFRPDRERWVAGVADQLFEFDTDPLRRAGLEADPVDMSFRVRLHARHIYRKLGVSSREQAVSQVRDGYAS